MTAFITVIHIFTALTIILVVLLQDSKGGGLGIGGMGSQTLFGSTGASSFLVKATKWLAIFFALTSITLAYTMNKSQKSVFDKEEIPIEASTSPKTSSLSPPTEKTKSGSEREQAPEQEVKTSKNHQESVQKEKAKAK